MVPDVMLLVKMLSLCAPFRLPSWSFLFPCAQLLFQGRGILAIAFEKVGYGVEEIGNTFLQGDDVAIRCAGGVTFVMFVVLNYLIIYPLPFLQDGS